MAACDLPVLVDADDGYGDAKNVTRTVQAYEAMGVAAIPYMVGVTIWISGKARPIPSASTSGIPRRAATVNGVVELSPPASADVV